MSDSRDDPIALDDWNPAWEPPYADQWIERDPLGISLQGRDHTRAENASHIAEIEFAAWARMPAAERERGWREREIAAEILARELMWHETERVERVSVGVRRVAGQRRTAIIVSVDTSDGREVPIDALPATLTIPSQISPRPGTPSERPTDVPIVLEAHHRTFPLSAATGGAKGVPCVGEPSDPPCERPAVGPSTVVRHRTARGLGGRRTVGLLVVDSFGSPRIVTAAHGLPDIGGVVCLADGTEIGRVDVINEDLDCALLKAEGNVYQYTNFAEPDLKPNEAILPITGLPVQIFGGLSGHSVGHILNSYSFDTSAGYRIGHHVDIVTSITVRQGDSGSLLLSGHSEKSSFNPARQGYVSSKLVDAMTFASLGILLEGTEESAPSEQQRQSTFSPIVDVLSTFDVIIPVELMNLEDGLVIHSKDGSPLETWQIQS